MQLGTTGWKVWKVFVNNWQSFFWSYLPVQKVSDLRWFTMISLTVMNDWAWFSCTNDYWQYWCALFVVFRSDGLLKLEPCRPQLRSLRDQRAVRRGVGPWVGCRNTTSWAPFSFRKSLSLGTRTTVFYDTLRYYTYYIILYDVWYDNVDFLKDLKYSFIHFESFWSILIWCYIGEKQGWSRFEMTNW